MRRRTVKGQKFFPHFPPILPIFFLTFVTYYPNHQINPNLLLIRRKSKKDLPITSLSVAFEFPLPSHHPSLRSTDIPRTNKSIYKRA